MRLYCAPNTISLAVVIALNEAGLDAELVRLSFKDADQTKPYYLSVNSKGRVPALVVGDTVLTETGAVLEYVAALAPQSGLVPSDPVQAARMRSVMFYLASTMHVNHAHKMRGHRWADREDSWADMTAKVPETMAASARFIETECLEGPFILGETLTIADAYLFTVCSWLEGDGVDVATFPKIVAFQHAMENRDAVKAARESGLLTS